MSGSACNAYQIRKIDAIGGALGLIFGLTMRRGRR